MYNIIQLNDKDLSELQSIAKELGIKKTDSLKKEDLVYKILDEQAIVGATQKVAAEKANERFRIFRRVPLFPCRCGQRAWERARHFCTVPFPAWWNPLGRS